ncbi:hypothetical protein [Sphingosinicella sp. BN140058]|uniref:hypothetical protein n=1 Tax=Sphingosinicella sp. BN140058 TaxID=1892855 RepID=UPI001010BA32|nr:hypothetical protein [Sphingosinicella sp. BN140058]QAY79232.1 hypothetical protein ETR14_23825 [Sphingosinicella sp. BN140058]
MRAGPVHGEPRHLIHIGFAKAGSTFLQRWFAAHPQIGYVEGGIAGYRDLYDVARQSAEPVAGIRWRVSSAEGLATPHPFVGLRDIDYRRMHGLQLPEAQAEVCRTLAALFPDASVLMITRGFRSMMLSSYSQYVRTGGADEFFALREGFGSEGHPSAHAWDYSGLIRLYRAAFGDRLIILPYELLRDDAGAFVELLEAKLGLDPCPPSVERVNEGLSGIEIRWYPRLSRLLRRLPIGRPLRDRMFIQYSRAATANRLRPLIRLLQWIRPAEPVTGALVSDDVLERFRPKAEALRGDPLYAPYKDEYLL